MPFRIALSIILDKDCITEDSIICTGEANSRGVCGEIQIPNLIPINHFVGLGIGTQLEWNEELAKTSANKAKYYENYLLLLNIAVSEVIRIKKELSLPFDIVDIVKEKPFELPETYDTSKQLILSKKINSTKV